MGAEWQACAVKVPRSPPPRRLCHGVEAAARGAVELLRRACAMERVCGSAQRAALRVLLLRRYVTSARRRKAAQEAHARCLNTVCCATFSVRSTAERCVARMVRVCRVHHAAHSQVAARELRHDSYVDSHAL